MIFLNGSNVGGESLASVYYELRERMVLWESKLRDTRHDSEDGKVKNELTWLLDDIKIYREGESKGLGRIKELIKAFRAYAGKLD